MQPKKRRAHEGSALFGCTHLVFTLLTTFYRLLTSPYIHSFVSSKLPSLRHVRHHLRMNAISCRVLVRDTRIDYQLPLNLSEERADSASNFGMNPRAASATRALFMLFRHFCLHGLYLHPVKFLFISLGANVL